MKNNVITPEGRNFFRNLKREEDIDELTFHQWKEELQKDLPEFWTTMNQKYTK